MQALPALLDDRRQRLQVHESTVVQDAARQMGVAVQQLYTCSADIRQCSDVIEGSVLALGVQTAHTLITQLSRSLKSIEAVTDAWRTTAAAHQEHCGQYRQLVGSLDQAYAGMRERRNAAEKELRALRTERDRKEQAYDASVMYVQQVLAEHTHWQEAHGYNTQRWPMTDACENALAALHVARAGTPAGNADRRGRKDGEMGREEALLPGKDDNSGSAGEASRSWHASFVSLSPPPPPPPPPPLREWPPAIASPTVDASEEGGDVARRWCSTMAGRLGAIQPSLHFAYVPPAKEVQLLREVLAMGTGSSVLMKDIYLAQARLDERGAQLRTVCVRSLSALHAMRQDLQILKTHLQHLLESHTPFTCMAEELLSRVRAHMEVEVARRVAAITAATAPAASSSTSVSPSASSSHSDDGSASLLPSSSSI
ncbi:hypothetical protein LSCM1_03602 [Leishmania martiniquensis]|uniref:Uncharacterized protein n=1 Tax=Leishmania martiniquensis TaxID=1580590 RepID=A0A836G5D6_9TRYP|nr:hypothetical protein LSCM1_03602 [Leishmania martiniquensis]